MITHISIENFAIIEKTQIDFGPGLNIVTGETGSGKSIVVTAISLALGSRADSSYVRNGKEAAYIELAGEADGEEIVVSRQINAQGRNLCRINGRLATLAELAETSAKIADIHGQYDNQSLLDPENHLALLDSFGQEKIRPLKEAYYALYQDAVAKKSALTSLLSKQAENARKADFYRFELKEIDDAHLNAGEDAELEDRVRMLQNSEKISGAATRALDLIDGDTGAYARLGSALSSLEEISGLSAGLKGLSEDVSDLYYRLEDAAHALRDTCEGLQYSPEELDESLSRLALLGNLKKKYGATIEEILSYRDHIAGELSLIENFDGEKARLQKAYHEAALALKEQAALLTAARKAAAEELSRRISEELKDLNFVRSDFTFDFRPAHYTATGADEAEMLISTNPGEPMKPLAKTASGGEISRIMLAIKKITATYDRIPTLIFDEIDQGISGRTASVVGRKLREIAAGRQVICITHLPQIAAMADQSYRIYKESDEAASYTHVARLDREARIDELARLLGGETVTEQARRNAVELIESAERSK
ncbi:MAG: DNA repair protein RecN [Eubacterium sp.]|nr:DNA repair protein RecN [Eubacterium sp.]